MKPGTLLDVHELQLIYAGLARHAEITDAILFGSRAKGTASPSSDIDLALEGIEDQLEQGGA